VRYAYGVTSALLLAGSALTLVTGFPAGAQVAQNDSSQIAAVVPRSGAPASFADLTQQLQPAVVNISTRQRVKVQANANPFAGTPFGDLFGGGQGGGGQGEKGGQGGGQTREAQSLGYIVTNNHVITAEGQGEVESITVTMTDGTDYPAKLIGKDAASDLAVLKITGSKPFPFVTFGDSKRSRVGDWVIAIGNPFGLGGTVTQGIISAVYRNTGTGSAYDRYLQTDASINRGNSGGPMFDMRGNVIGINNAIFSPTGGSVGIGFAIPAETAAPIVEKLKNGVAIERGYLGVRIQPLSDDLAASLGIPKKRGEFVQSVEPGQGAAKAGLQPGDVVISVDGTMVTPEQSLSYIVANTAPGKHVPLAVMRNGQSLTLNAVVGKRPSEEELAKQTFDPEQKDDEDFGPGSAAKPHPNAPAMQASLGVAVIPVTTQIAHQLGLGDDVHGVVITEVDESSDAAAKGLQRGDIILSANYKSVASRTDLDTIVKQAKSENREAILLRIQRRGQPAFYFPVRLH